MKIGEIAKLAGVSPSTVSRVFNHRASISEEVRQKVLAVAREHAYHPRLTVRQRNVVIITPYSSMYPPQCCVEMILMALTGELPKRGFRLEILPHDNLERLASMQFCAAAAIGAEPEDFRNWSSEQNVPLIMIDRDMETYAPDVYVVRPDVAMGVDLALDKLTSSGRKRIGCIIHGKPGTGNADLRAEAVRTYMKKKNLPELIHFGDDQDYLEIIGKLLRKKIDALFCPGGSGGILAAYALSLFGKQIPDDVALIASEQTFFSRYGIPPQTTISPDYTELARAVADVIESRINGEAVKRKTVLPYVLIERESV